MIPEKRFLNQIQQVLARLMQPLWLLDTEGTVLLPEENRSSWSRACRWLLRAKPS